MKKQAGRIAYHVENRILAVVVRDVIRKRWTKWALENDKNP
jgi:hypothetical protein